MTGGGRLFVFQGDSITDAGRRDDPDGLGDGYVRLIADRLPRDRVQNAGVSGDRIGDLARRWDVDTLAHRPDVVSILIGINDVWHQRTGGDVVSVETFGAIYRGLLQRALATCPSVELVVCEPFALLCGVVDADWLPALDERRAVVRELASTEGARFVALQAAFATAVESGLVLEALAADGVHPSALGHEVIADAWLAAVLTE